MKYIKQHLLPVMQRIYMTIHPKHVLLKSELKSVCKGL